jgi:hypothetical protein
MYNPLRSSCFLARCPSLVLFSPASSLLSVRGAAATAGPRAKEQRREGDAGAGDDGGEKRTRGRACTHCSLVRAPLCRSAASHCSPVVQSATCKHVAYRHADEWAISSQRRCGAATSVARVHCCFCRCCSFLSRWQQQWRRGRRRRVSLNPLPLADGRCTRQWRKESTRHSE